MAIYTSAYTKDQIDSILGKCSKLAKVHIDSESNVSFSDFNSLSGSNNYAFTCSGGLSNKSNKPPTTYTNYTYGYIEVFGNNQRELQRVTLTESNNDARFEIWQRWRGPGGTWRPWIKTFENVTT